MVREVSDIAAFISAHPPFDRLTSLQVERASDGIATAYALAQDRLRFGSSEQVPGLIMLRVGSIEVRTPRGRLIDRLGPGDYLIPERLERDFGDRVQVNVIEDSLYYELSSSVMNSLREDDTSIDELITHAYPNLKMAQGARRLPVSPDAQILADSEDVRERMSHEVRYVDAEVDIQQAATAMRDHGISALLIKQGDELTGIVTDRDLRNRVLAAGLDTSTPIADVMTRSPVCISPDGSLIEAQLVMMTEGLSHLPVVEGTETLGMLSLSDILRASNAEPLPLVHAIHKSGSVDEMVRHAEEIPSLIAGLIEGDTAPTEIGRILTSFSDALTRRLLMLAESELGDAPCPYTWIAFGSQARQEMVLGSDQDNGLLLADDVDASMQAYFASLAEFVNMGLDRCGMPYCPGDVMARNPEWRQPLTGWTARFIEWIENPSPDALMRASIFFDMRAISGDVELLAELQTTVLERAGNNTIFLAMMNDNALQRRPPLGFFRTFVLESDGEHEHTLNLKKRGTIPIVDIARNYALSCGIHHVNTLDRLRHLIEDSEMSDDLGGSLIDAHEFIAEIRLQAQANELRAGKLPDNHIDPDTLSPLTRHQLKDAFDIVREAQQAMSARFGAGVL